MTEDTGKPFEWLLDQVTDDKIKDGIRFLIQSRSAAIVDAQWQSQRRLELQAENERLRQLVAYQGMDDTAAHMPKQADACKVPQGLIQALLDFASANPGTYVVPGWDGHSIKRALSAAPTQVETLPAQK